MKVRVESVVPPGMYSAVLVQVREYEQDGGNNYGPAMLWVWKVLGGKYDGHEVARVTGQRVSPKTALGRLLSGILGSLPPQGTDIDTDSLIGEEHKVIVSEADGGGTRVEHAVKATEVPHDANQSQ